jgi:AraC-like DNA-binding protein
MGGVARYIQRERLLEAHALLSDPEKVQSISQIAEDLCFADASSFSRIFKREFGCTPTEARYAAPVGAGTGCDAKNVGSAFRQSTARDLDRDVGRLKAGKVWDTRHGHGIPGSSPQLRTSLHYDPT